ncbi:MAG: hypothetical protein WAU24_13365, partial [Chitinophagaceae bacterium]
TNELYSYLKAESIIKKDISVDSKLILYDNGNAAYLIDSHDGKRFGHRNICLNKNCGEGNIPPSAQGYAVETLWKRKKIK